MERREVNQDELYFTIADVADQIGVVPATIRNWEKQGLFQAKRGENGYRVYDLSDIEQLRGIKSLSKDKSMGINAIRMFRRQKPEDASIPRSPSVDQETMVSKKLLGKKWRQYRLDRGYLLEEVAGAIGISASYLSKIELTQANVSYAILKKLADFYGENILYYLVDSEDARPLVKRNQGEKLPTDVPGLIIESVIARQDATLSSLLYTVAPGCGRTIPTRHSGEEFVHVFMGELQMTIEDETFPMAAGDSLSFNSQKDHSWFNPGTEDARILWVYTALVKNFT